MKKILLFAFMGCFLAITARAQNDSLQEQKVTNLIHRIINTTSKFKIDTTAVPNDRITKKILELRKYRGSFNVDALIDFKLRQDKNNHQISEAEYNREYHFFKDGIGRRWIDNAVIWVYRKHFTYKELRSLARFYKSPAGQKWGSEFPIVIIQVGMAAEQVGKICMKMDSKK